MAELNYTCADVGVDRNTHKSCCVDGCDGKHKGKGLCAKHYMQMRKAEIKDGAIRYATPKPRELCKCKQCGKEYKPKAVDRTTYCSRQCSFDAKHQKYIDRDLDAPFSAVVHCTCVVCSVGFWNKRVKKHCSRSCNLEDGRRKQASLFVSKALVEQRACSVCEKLFLSNTAAQHVCSRKCLKKKYGHHHRARARHYGVAYEPVNVHKVFARDGWKCQICGKPTPKTRRGSQYPNAPELDHRIPISKGGPHTYSNVQCACRACNGEKSNKLEIGQLPLLV